MIYNGKFKVTSPFGSRNLNGKIDNHKGIDVVGLTDKHICAVAGGTVGASMIITDKNNLTWEWGNYVRIDGDDGRKYYYCHMSKRLVSAGQRIKAGDVIGIEGNTGYSFGSHCHFEVRQNNVSINPAPFLGIDNAVGTYEVNASAGLSNKSSYTVNGIRFERIDNFTIKYWDKPKKQIPNNASTGGFWAAYSSSAGEKFTLPVGNLVCDCSASDVPAAARKYISPHISGGKLRINCADNQSSQFKGRKVSTLIVPSSGKPYIADVSEVPLTAKYAISGVPTVRNGDDVDYYNYVKAQGWDDSCMYATWRSWLGVREGEIWLISGKTTSKNYIYGMEIWKKLKSEGFDDVITLDGGGSWAIRRDSSYTGTSGNRCINNIILV